MSFYLALVSKNDALSDGIEERDIEINRLKEKISRLENKGARKIHNQRNVGKKPQISENTDILIQNYRIRVKQLKKLTKLPVSLHKHCKSI